MSKTQSVSLKEREMVHRNVLFSERKDFETSEGTLILQNFCSPSLVESLRADRGLRAFARLPEREHQLLLGLARQPEAALALAYTKTGEIVGQVTLAPADAWWQGVANTYEIGLEVSTYWRKQGIAHQLLDVALDLDSLEDIIILAIGLSWHWDTENAGVHIFGYRALIEKELEKHGFVEYLTNDPNVSMESANFLMARIGSRVEPETLNQFLDRLICSDTLL